MRGSINEGTPIAGWFMKPPNVMMNWAWVKLAEKKKLCLLRLQFWDVYFQTHPGREFIWIFV